MTATDKKYELVAEDTIEVVAHIQQAAPGLALTSSARLKARDVARCEFSHFACGRPFAFWMPDCWLRRGENLAYGFGYLGAPRSIFRAWLRSPGHRANLLEPWDRFGVAVRREGALQFWVAHFGGPTR